jgi:hypothetical protein
VPVKAAVFLLSEGGGETALTADAIEAAGYELSPPSPELAEALHQLTGLPNTRRNPLDLQGLTDANPAIYGSLVRAVLNERKYDAIVLGSIFGSYGTIWDTAVEHAELKVASELASLEPLQSKLIVQSPYALNQSVALARFRAAGIPCLELPSEVVCALNSRNVINSAGRLPGRADGDFASRADGALVASTARLVAALEKAEIDHNIGEVVQRDALPANPNGRWVVRADGFPHKAAASAIHVDISSERLPICFDQLVSVARSAGLQPCIRLAPYFDHDCELIISFWRNSAEGSGWVIGRGGGAAEDYHDTVIGRWPHQPEDVQRQLGQTRIGATLLTNNPQGAKAVIELGLKLARLFKDGLADLDEIEFNPVAIGGGTARVLDVLAIQGPDSATTGPMPSALEAWKLTQTLAPQDR